MRVEFIIHPQYAHLSEFLLSLPESFDSLAEAAVLRDVRNVTKAVKVNGIRLVIKSYRHISWLNRRAYGTLRDSKAMRAYHYAERLTALGIGTPRPIAAIDCFSGGVLVNSFFVSLYTDYASAEVVNRYPDDAEQLCPLMDSVAGFIVRLHACGVLHHDLNLSNILFRKNSRGEYDFQVIDINRMSFKRRLTTRQRIENLSTLSCSPAAYAYILHRYALLSKNSEQRFEMQGHLSRLMRDRRKTIHNALKTRKK